jgi:TetR/AcrR family transcriptional repressor of nem operon
MARPREFDEVAVLDAAMECFWERGFEATSVRELAAEMGIASPSLYNAFGDKRALFRKVLEHYARRRVRARIAHLESTLAPKEAVRAFVTGIVDQSLDDQDRRGCLLVNSALEIGPHDAEIGTEIAARLSEVEAFFRRAITAAQEDHTIPSDRSPQDLSRLILGVVLGIRVLARSMPDRALLEGVARPALALLESDQTRQTRTPSTPKAPSTSVKRKSPCP